ncbi:RnfABCDGE type electron transport complex subunit A [bacterium]|nr:RnfABCDGE type electron transport complex subunit A [bacterium]
MELFGIFIAAAVINNFVLIQFLGICPFVGVSGKLSSAVSMGMAVTFVMTMASMVTFLIQHYILIPAGIGFLQTVAFILVIASLVQFVEMVIKKVSTGLYRALGIFLPLITTNCAIMGLCLFAVMKDYSFIQTLIFAIGAGAGFTLALVLMAGIREELELADVPETLQGAGITMIVAGILALGFMGFAGMKF